MALIIVNTLMNFFFLIDIFVNFTSAYYDEDFNLVDDFKVRAKSLKLAGDSYSVHEELAPSRHRFNHSLRHHIPCQSVQRGHANRQNRKTLQDYQNDSNGTHAQDSQRTQQAS